MTDERRVELVSGEVVIIHPGDVAVLSFDAPISAADAAKVRTMWAEHAPLTDVVILGAPATLAAVIRAADRDDHDRPIL